MFAPSLNGMPMLDVQGPPPHWRAPWLSNMAMRLSTDLTLPGTTAACVNANDGLGKQQATRDASAACMCVARATQPAEPQQATMQMNVVAMRAAKAAQSVEQQ
jgi:hypothetical protein